jgi:hypothetical protein
MDMPEGLGIDPQCAGNIPKSFQGVKLDKDAIFQ